MRVTSRLCDTQPPLTGIFGTTLVNPSDTRFENRLWDPSPEGLDPDTRPTGRLCGPSRELQLARQSDISMELCDSSAPRLPSATQGALAYLY